MNAAVQNNGLKGFERHAQTVIVLLVTALLLWMVKTTQEMTVSLAELQIQVTTLRDTPHPVENDKLALIESRLGAIELQLAILTAKNEPD